MTKELIQKDMFEFQITYFVITSSSLNQLTP